MTHVRWSPLALRDLAAVDTYYTDLAPDFVDRVEMAVLAATRLLMSTADAGARIDKRGTRKWSVQGVPYIVLYRNITNGILVVRIHHNRSNWRTV